MVAEKQAWAILGREEGNSQVVCSRDVDPRGASWPGWASGWGREEGTDAGVAGPEVKPTQVADEAVGTGSLEEPA